MKNWLKWKLHGRQPTVFRVLICYRCHRKCYCDVMHQTLNLLNLYMRTQRLTRRPGTFISDKVQSQSQPRKDLIQTTDARHRIPNFEDMFGSSQNWRRVMMTIDREIILSKLFCSKDLKRSVASFKGLFIGMFPWCESPLSKCKYKLFFGRSGSLWVIRDIPSSKY